MRSARSQEPHIPNSLMSGATAHTVKPSLRALEAYAPVRPRQKYSPPLLVALAAISAGLALAATAGVSHLRARSAPIAQIVSGTPALKKSADGADVRWHSAKANLYLDASLDALGNHAREAVQLGFGTWLSSGAKLPGLGFDSTTGAKFAQTPNGKSEIMYGPITVPGHEKDLALTITFSDPTTGEVLEADMIFNSLHPYGLLSGQGSSGDDSSQHDGSTHPGSSGRSDCSEKYDLQSVATHEAGHFFGLGEDYDSKPATMYFSTGRCETNKRALQSSDETTVTALYVKSEMQSGADPSVDSGKGCGGARIGQGSTSGNAAVLMALGVLGFVALRRRTR